MPRLIEGRKQGQLKTQDVRIEYWTGQFDYPYLQTFIYSHDIRRVQHFLLVSCQHVVAFHKA